MMAWSASQTPRVRTHSAASLPIQPSELTKKTNTIAHTTASMRNGSMDRDPSMARITFPCPDPPLLDRAFSRTLKGLSHFLSCRSPTPSAHQDPTAQQRSRLQGNRHPNPASTGRADAHAVSVFGTFPTRQFNFSRAMPGSLSTANIAAASSPYIKPRQAYVPRSQVRCS